MAGPRSARVGASSSLCLSVSLSQSLARSSAMCPPALPLLCYWLLLLDQGVGGFLSGVGGFLSKRRGKPKSLRTNTRNDFMK